MIKTDRLLLREMDENDYDALYAVLADSDIMQHYPYTFDETRVRGWISRNIERYQIFGFGLWAVCLRENGEMIGDCGLTMQSINGVIKPEIGYHIRRDHQRKGYAKEAAIVVRDWTFQNTPFNVIYSYMKYTNTPSASVAVSWGCHQVDEFKDEVNEITKVFAITREEWQKLTACHVDPDTDKSAEVLLSNVDKLHTTPLGVERIKQNLKTEADDVVAFCKQKILSGHCKIYRQGKNWYCETEDLRITVNAKSYTIITVHRRRDL